MPPAQTTQKDETTSIQLMMESFNEYSTSLLLMMVFSIMNWMAEEGQPMIYSFYFQMYQNALQLASEIDLIDIVDYNRYFSINFINSPSSSFLQLEWCYITILMQVLVAFQSLASQIQSVIERFCSCPAPIREESDRYWQPSYSKHPNLFFLIIGIKHTSSTLLTNSLIKALQYLNESKLLSLRFVILAWG